MTELAAMLAWVAAGSFFGGAARFFVSGVVARAVGETFPWGTMVVNVTGAFCIGALFALVDMEAVVSRPEAWPLVATGFLGSYTTVSSLSLQTLALAREGDWVKAAGNIVLSLAMCLSAVVVGVVGVQVFLPGGLS